MMKKVGYTLFTIALLMIFTPLVKAEGTCSSTILYDEKVNASEVTVSYEEAAKVIQDEALDPEVQTIRFLKLKIANVPDNVEIQVTSLDKSFNEFKLKSTQKNEDNNIFIDDNNIYKIKRIQFDVVSTSNECNGEKLKTLTLNTPMFNELSNAPICAKYPDFKYCAVFTDFDISSLSTTDFNKELEKYEENIEAEKNEEEKITEKAAKAFKKYWYIALIVLVVILGGLVTFVVIKKKRSSVI